MNTPHHQKLYSLCAIAALAGAVATSGGCATGDVQDDGGDNNAPSTGGDASGGSGTGGAAAATCAEDCSAIAAPDCFEAVCNDGMHEGPIGACVVVPTVDGATCDDGLFCTVNDACVAGACEGGPQNTCGAELEPCQDVVCDESTQACDYAPSVNGASCAPTSLCEVNGVCTAGACVGQQKDCSFAPGAECNTVSCNPASGVCEGPPDSSKDGQACQQSGDLCMVDKTCNNGQCLGGGPKDCGALTVGCQNGVCDANSGNCVGMAVPAGGTCLDAADACNTGVCDMNGTCNPVPLSDGTSCSDFNSCTTSDTCSSGSCGGTAVPMCTTYFENNFEAGCAGWTLSGDWQCGTVGSGPGAALSGSEGLATNLVGDYSGGNNFASTVATTPPIDLSSSSQPVLSFWAWVHTESVTWDAYNVKISTDGVNFNVAAPASVDPPFDGVLSTENAWGGNYSAEGWRLHTIDLSAFVGQQIHLRWAFENDSIINYPGVYIDDVTVSEAAAVPLSISAPSLPNTYTSVGYNAAVTKSGGSSASVWSIVGGTNHSWLSIDPMTGVLSGMPLAANTGPVTVTVHVEEPTVSTNFDEVTYNFGVMGLIYDESFDATCPASWTLGGDWQCGAPAVVGPATSFDGSQCLGTQIAGDYNSSQAFGTAIADSPSVSLAGSTNAELSFYAYVHSEGSAWDGFNIKVSTDGGSTFTQVMGATPVYDLTVDSQDAWGGDQSAFGWQLFTADLTPYVGGTVVVRFYFRSDSCF
jgi:hypothetical protein